MAYMESISSGKLLRSFQVLKSPEYDASIETYKNPRKNNILQVVRPNPVF